MPVTINLAYEPTAIPTVNQQADILYASNQWELALNANGHNLTINAEVWAVDMSATPLNAMCVPGLIQTANATLTRPQAKLSGDLVRNDPAVDIVIIMDTVTPWVLGTPPLVAVGPNQHSLSTTIMHEICHGLGFLGLCNVDTTVMPNIGIYTDANLLVQLTATLGAMVPVVTLPAYFFPAVPASGFGVITPFANLFQYVPPLLVKGTPADDFVAFTTANNIIIHSPNANYTVLSTLPFHPFTTCDHIVGAPYLMNPSTEGQYYPAPDAASLDILQLIGW